MIAAVLLAREKGAPVAKHVNPENAVARNCRPT
jgi:hypothetical protein